jgi:phosphatidylinositol-3,4,5-trisphosphate 3-phosphatase/dual-specificity protein phosphatase PTEN
MALSAGSERAGSWSPVTRWVAGQGQTERGDQVGAADGPQPEGHLVWAPEPGRRQAGGQLLEEHTVIMINKLRELVGGAKQRYICEGYNLDLTYITPRLVAMAYPASDLIEKTYRNSISDVAELLERNHGDAYLVVNASGREYDYTRFKGVCFAMEWEDHSAPLLTTLIETCWKMQEFLLQQPNSAIAVHCNHGKGRTGTLLISFILYNLAFPTMQEAKLYYEGKRFSEGKLRISQPCQLRYLKYMERLIQVFPPRLVSKRLLSITFEGLNSGKCRVKILSMRMKKLLFESGPLEGSSHSLKLGEGIRMVGDTTLYVIRCTLTGEYEEARLSLHSCFLKAGDHTFAVQDFSPDSLAKKGVYGAEFKAVLEVGEDCVCASESCKQCNDAWMSSEQFFWQRAKERFDRSRKMPLEKMEELVFGKVRL